MKNLLTIALLALALGLGLGACGPDLVEGHDEAHTHVVDPLTCDPECPETLLCHPEYGVCVRCLTNSDCTYDYRPEFAVCLTEADFTCVECRIDSDCFDGELCWGHTCA